jgi:DNA-binding IclR family transcriptional regulator
VKKKGRAVGADLAENRRGIQSVEVGIQLLKALQNASSSVTLTALSDAAEMTASKAHRYLASYVRTGLVRQDPHSREYELGPAALTLGLAVLSQLDIISLAVEAGRKVAESTGHTVVVSVWSDRGAVIIRWLRGAEPIVTSLDLGSVLPALSSATGQVFVANLPRIATASAVRTEQRSRQKLKNTPLSEPQIEEMIAKVRKQGAAWVDSGDRSLGWQAISYPVLDNQGEAAAALTLLIVAAPVGNAEHPSAQALARACEEVSRQAVVSGLPGPRRR